jgi:hypothetical protein
MGLHQFLRYGQKSSPDPIPNTQKVMASQHQSFNPAFAHIWDCKTFCGGYDGYRLKYPGHAEEKCA